MADSTQSAFKSSVDSFSESDHDDGSNDHESIHRSQIQANRKNKRSGGFQTMGLSQPVFRAILKCGYKVPTPIQRRSIPLIMEGQDVVAMARTGSGKTAAFLIPLFERLKTHSVAVGARALILAPSRELAMQTLKFARDFGKYTDIRCALIVGGDSMDEQFSQIASNPDIIIATPGRLFHVMMEMDLNLKSVEFVVFDEADRLFELGFADTISEIINKISLKRQTLLFSATLPRCLIEFSRAGLTDPVLIRLDVDTKLSPDLALAFFAVKSLEKEAILLHLLRNVITADEQTIIFVSTKHHVEYLHELLLVENIQNSYIYGALDQMARLESIANFRSGATKVLLVTDVAARGIDIPHLNNVINYDFPDKCKLFVHRAGRSARAGQQGTAYSFVTIDDLPYIFDLQLFLSRQLILSGDLEKMKKADMKCDLIYGNLPSSLIADEIATVSTLLDQNSNLASLRKVSCNGHKLYAKTRHIPCPESFKRAKDLQEVAYAGSCLLGIHPVFHERVDASDTNHAILLDQLRQFRPAETIFEFRKMGMSKPSAARDVMKAVRHQKTHVIIKAREARHLKTQKVAENYSSPTIAELVPNSGSKTLRLAEPLGAPVSDFKDPQFYISSVPADLDTERGLSVAANDPASNFMKAAASVELDLTGDDKTSMAKNTNTVKWDSRKKRFVSSEAQNGNKKMVRTESGKLVSASYKTKAFSEWQKKTKIHVPSMGEMETSKGTNGGASSSSTFVRKFKHNKTTAAKPLDPLSIDYERKLKKRKRQDGGEEQGQKRYASNRNVKDELKDLTTIRRDVKIKELKRQKNGRAPKGGKGKARR